MRISELLDGEECPECGRPIDAGSLRYEGHQWAHRSEHPQGGHHGFDVLEALGVNAPFVPTEVREHRGDLHIIGEVVVGGGL